MSVSHAKGLATHPTVQLQIEHWTWCDTKPQCSTCITGYFGECDYSNSCTVGSKSCSQLSPSPLATNVHIQCNF